MTEDSATGSSQEAPSTRLENRFGRVEESLSSISQILIDLLGRTRLSEKDTDRVGSVDSQATDQVNSEDVVVELLLDEEKQESASKAEEKERIKLSELPSIAGKRNEHFPERLEELYEKRAKLAHRNSWPMTEAFAGSPLPAQFEFKNHIIDDPKGERNKSELKE